MEQQDRETDLVRSRFPGLRFLLIDAQKLEGKKGPQLSPGLVWTLGVFCLARRVSTRASI